MVYYTCKLTLKQKFFEIIDPNNYPLLGWGKEERDWVRLLILIFAISQAISRHSQAMAVNITTA
jgi:hypothetical protein